MRTNIVIDDNLMKKAMAAAGKKTKKETVEAGLRELILKRANQDMLSLRSEGWGWDECESFLDHKQDEKYEQQKP